MRSVVLCNKYETDIGAWRYVTQALGGSTQYIITEANENYIKSLDCSEDLFLGIIYQADGNRFQREWLQKVKKLYLYMFSDVSLSFPFGTIQSIKYSSEVLPPTTPLQLFVHTNEPSDLEVMVVPTPTITSAQLQPFTRIVQSPYPIRPWFAEQIKMRPEQPEIDVIWLGTESYYNGVYWLDSKTFWGTGYRRRHFLDDFESSIHGKFTFHRDGNIHPIDAYVSLMRLAKIAISINGIAEHSFRTYEAIYAGICVIAQRHVRELLWADHTEVIPQFNTAAEAVEICYDLINSGAWRELRDHQREWLADNYSEERLRRWGEGVVSAM